MHNNEMNVNPPMMIPVHASGRPHSFRLRIWYRETRPSIKAVTPERTLAGKQTKPVNGIGTNPPQNAGMVRMPKMELRMDCRLVGK